MNDLYIAIKSLGSYIKIVLPILVIQPFSLLLNLIFLVTQQTIIFFVSVAGYMLLNLLIVEK